MCLSVADYGTGEKGANGESDCIRNEMQSSLSGFLQLDSFEEHWQIVEYCLGVRFSDSDLPIPRVNLARLGKRLTDETRSRVDEVADGDTCRCLDQTMELA